MKINEDLFKYPSENIKYLAQQIRDEIDAEILKRLKIIANLKDGD